MTQTYICDLCGKRCLNAYEENIYLGTTWGRTECIDVCLDCVAKISKLIKREGLLRKKGDAHG